MQFGFNISNLFRLLGALPCTLFLPCSTNGNYPPPLPLLWHEGTVVYIKSFNSPPARSARGGAGRGKGCAPLGRGWQGQRLRSLGEGLAGAKAALPWRGAGRGKGCPPLGRGWQWTWFLLLRVMHQRENLVSKYLFAGSVVQIYWSKRETKDGMYSEGRTGIF